MNQEHAGGGVFEECLSRAYEFRFGWEIERFVTADLAEVYDGLLLVRQFFRLAGAASPDDTVEISEMLPGPDQLWLRLDQHGYTSELRCTVFSR